MKKQLNEIRKNEEGAALVLAMMVFMVLSVLGATVGAVTVGSYKLGDANQETNSAYYIAEAGANMAYEEIENYVLEAYENSENKVSFFENMEKPLGKENNQTTQLYDKFDTQSGDTPTAEIAIIPKQQDGNTKEYTIESVGEVGGKTRTVKKTFEVNWLEPQQNDSLGLDLSSVLTFNSSPTINDETTVKGDITYPNSLNFKVNNNFNHIVGTINPIPDEEFNWIEKGNTLQDWLVPIVQNEFSAHDFNNNLNNDSSYNEKYTENKDVIANNEQLTFNNGVNFIGSIIGNGGDIVINGEAIIEGDVITNGGNITFNNGVIITGNIISNGGSITINGETTINGSIITTGNSKKITVNNGAAISGNIIANGGDLVLNGIMDVNGAILNPRGDVRINNGGNFEGVVYVRNIVANGEKSFIYSEDYLNYFPFKHNQSSEDDFETSLDDLISSAPALEQ